MTEVEMLFLIWGNGAALSMALVPVRRHIIEAMAQSTFPENYDPLLFPMNERLNSSMKALAYLFLAAREHRQKSRTITLLIYGLYSWIGVSHTLNLIIRYCSMSSSLTPSERKIFNLLSDQNFDERALREFVRSIPDAK
ncbi:MAG: hypothetical protein IPJ84_10295 [Bdellovibrionales bacterium]|nr:hypothetical protein [Bdellovibrionales bacterium]